MTQTADASGNYTLSSTEVAQRLSFMLWGSIPDDALNTAADNNQLSTPAQILTQAQRMLTSDKARLKIADFHRSYILMGPNTRWDTGEQGHDAVPGLQHDAGPDADGGDREVLRLGRGGARRGRSRTCSSARRRS